MEQWCLSILFERMRSWYWDVLGSGKARRTQNLRNSSRRRNTKAVSWLWLTRNTWYPKQPFFNGCFNWMIPNLYVGNGCFTKHPFKNGCLGFQVFKYSYLVYNCFWIAWQSYFEAQITGKSIPPPISMISIHLISDHWTCNVLLCITVSCLQGIQAVRREFKTTLSKPQ